MKRLRKYTAGIMAALFCAVTALAQYGDATLTNKSGGTVSQYDVVVADSSNSAAFKTTTTSRDTKFIGVVVAPSINNNVTGSIVLPGAIVKVRVTGTVTLGDYLVTSTTAGAAASGGTTNISGAFAIALETGTNTNVKAYLLSPQQFGTSSTISVGTINLPDDTGKLIVGTGSDVQYYYDETTDDRAEWSDGTNTLGYVKDNGTIGTIGSTGAIVAQQSFIGGNQYGSLSPSADTPVYIWNRPANTSGTLAAIAAVQEPTATGTISAVGVSSSTRTIGAITVSNLLAFDTNVQTGNNASGVATNARSLRAVLTNNGAGTITNYYGVNVANSGSTGAVTNFYGLAVDANTSTGANANGATLKYGLKIGDISGAATTNRAIETGLGGVVFGGRMVPTVKTAFTANDTTPSVQLGNLFTIPATWTAGNNITTLDDGLTGQQVMIIGGDSDCVFNDASTLVLNGAWTAAASATLILVFDGTNWNEIARSAN